LFVSGRLTSTTTLFKKRLNKTKKISRAQNS
jgi:hypothetical protein